MDGDDDQEAAAERGQAIRQRHEGIVAMRCRQQIADFHRPILGTLGQMSGGGVESGQQKEQEKTRYNNIGDKISCKQNAFS